MTMGEYCGCSCDKALPQYLNSAKFDVQDNQENEKLHFQPEPWGKRLQNTHPWASRRWEKWLVRRSQILVETHTGSDPPLPGALARVKDCYNVTSPRVTCHVSRALTNRLLWPEDFSCHKKLFIIELVTRAFLRTCVSGSGDYQILKRFVFRMRVWHLSSFGRGKYPHYLSLV